MAGPFTGMDIPAVRQLAQQLTSKADEIQQIMTTLTNLLQNTQWVGADRERYLADWQGSHVTALNNVINGLRDASQKATQNASEQEQASS
ncbi:MAG TPA: WXG100 family type VII secretion target [Ilumatobacteraceae bacterium]|nr:WXG100 family type VII secretion target [Ilumatobacteraceae bacterium]